MNRNRFFVFGCLGAIAVISALVIIIYVTLRGPFELAQSRWAAKGSGDYTLTVSEDDGWTLPRQYKLTVQSSRLVGIETLSNPSQPDGAQDIPADNVQFYDRLTIAEMLKRAGREQGDTWQDPWLRRFLIVYDPVYGYVSNYASYDNGRIKTLLGSPDPGPGYSYAAYDFVPAQP